MHVGVQLVVVYGSLPNTRAVNQVKVLLKCSIRTSVLLDLNLANFCAWVLLKVRCCYSAKKQMPTSTSPNKRFKRLELARHLNFCIVHISPLTLQYMYSHVLTYYRSMHCSSVGISLEKTDWLNIHNPLIRGGYFFTFGHSILSHASLDVCLLPSLLNSSKAWSPLTPKCWHVSS